MQGAHTSPQPEWSSFSLPGDRLLDHLVGELIAFETFVPEHGASEQPSF